MSFLRKQRVLSIVSFLAFLALAGLIYGAFVSSGKDVPTTIQSLTTDQSSYLVGSPVRIEASLMAENQNLSYQFLNVLVNNNFMGSGMTDISGNFIFNLFTPFMQPGSYLLRLEFEGALKGEMQYLPSSAETSFSLAKELSLGNEITGEAIITQDGALSSPIPYQFIESCSNQSWTETIYHYGNCTRDYEEMVCEDKILNTSCSPIIKTNTFPCSLGKEEVQQSKIACIPTALEINRQGIKEILSFGDWGNCSPSFDAATLTIICDSIHDGNGNGKCEPGESCTKYAVSQNSIEQSKRNSKSYFMSSDATFFLPELKFEAVQ